MFEFQGLLSSLKITVPENALIPFANAICDFGYSYIVSVAQIPRPRFYTCLVNEVNAEEM